MKHGMKKNIILVILMCAVLCFGILAGCEDSGGNAASQGNAPSVNADGKIELEVGGSGTGTFIYSLCVAISEIVNKSSDSIFMNVQETADRWQNIPDEQGRNHCRLGAGSFDLAASSARGTF